MRVTTSCPTRFWIFDQARELQRAGVLHRLVTTSPRFQTRQWGLADDRVDSMWMYGAWDRLLSSLSRRGLLQSRERFARASHARFSRLVADHVPLDSDVLIGLSCFSLPAMERARAHGIVTVLDHGSLHERIERTLVREEAQLWGLGPADEWPYDWVIEQEDAEFAAADHIMVLSEVARRSLIAEGVAPEKIWVNPCGVDLASFRPGSKTDDVFRVVQVGAIAPRKGLPYLLQAFTELDLPRSELWLVGSGAGSSALAPVLERYRSDKVHFKGAVPQRQLPEIYAQCSVAVLASVADGFGLVVPQAMACGLPVIVTENVGAADIIVNGENGRIVPIRDVEALKEGLLYLYNHRDHMREMGRAALDSVSRGHSWHDYGNRLVSFLDSVGRRAA